MGDVTELRHLLARVKAAPKADRELDHALHRLDMGEWLDKHGYRRDGDGYVTDTPPMPDASTCCGPEYLTGDIGVAIEFMRRVFPDAEWQRIDDQMIVRRAPVHAMIMYGATGATDALAMCAAILMAKIDAVRRAPERARVLRAEADALEGRSNG